MSLKIDVTKFNSMCRQLGALTVGQHQPALDYEVSKVMETCVRLTPAASIGKIREFHDNAEFSAQPETLYTPTSAPGIRSRAKARRLKGNLLLYNLTNRYPDQLWAKIVEARGKRLKDSIRARGLSKRTWFAIARALGYEVTAAGFVKKAVPSSPKVSESQYLGGMRVKRIASRGFIAVHIENAQPTINKIGGDRILQRAINSRVRFFARNLALGVFNSAKAVAKKYPGIRVSSSTPT